MRYAPDKNNPFPQHPGNGGGNNNGGGQGNGMGGFMPGQINGIANDLQMGYGGTDAKWKNYLKDVYSPVKPMGFNFGGGNGGGKGNQPSGNNQGGGPGGNNNGGGFEPSRPRNAMMPAMGVQAPQMGLLNGSMQQQPQQQGLLGDIDPQILAYLTRR
jgi:hypothetical protein